MRGRNGPTTASRCSIPSSSAAPARASTNAPRTLALAQQGVSLDDPLPPGRRDPRRDHRERSSSSRARGGCHEVAAGSCARLACSGRRRAAQRQRCTARPTPKTASTRVLADPARSHIRSRSWSSITRSAMFEVAGYDGRWHLRSRRGSTRPMKTRSIGCASSLVPEPRWHGPDRDGGQITAARCKPRLARSSVHINIHDPRAAQHADRCRRSSGGQARHQEHGRGRRARHARRARSRSTTYRGELTDAQRCRARRRSRRHSARCRRGDDVVRSSISTRSAARSWSRRRPRATDRGPPGAVARGRAHHHRGPDPCWRAEIALHGLLVVSSLRGDVDAASCTGTARSTVRALRRQGRSRSARRRPHPR